MQRHGGLQEEDEKDFERRFYDAEEAGAQEDDNPFLGDQQQFEQREEIGRAHV